MRRTPLRAVSVVIAALALASAASGSTDQRSIAQSAAKTCSAGYVHADLSWGEKCLRAGEFCKVANAEYHPYGYTCPASGHLSYYAGSSAPKQSTSIATQSSSATAKCRDGTYSYSANHSGACSHHGGVSVWYR